MSEQLSATIEVGLDGSKVQEGVAPIARTLENLGKTARKAGTDAGDGIGKIGEGGAASAAKVEASTRNMIGSIQRTTAALEAGTKSGAEYFEALARQRGVDPAVLRPYLAQLDLVREKQEEAATSSAAMSTALKTAGVVAVSAIGGFVIMIKGTIDAADSLNDLSKTTGVTVEQLAGLRLAAQQSGGDLDGIAKSINKLSVNIGKDGEKFKQLGIDAKDPLEAFKQLADVFKAIDDPQTRAALGAAALGKSWESAAPLLSEGGKAIGEMVAKGTALSGVTSQLTQDSDAFNDSIAELSAGIAGQFAGATSALLPLMNELSKSLADSSAAAKNSPSDFSPLAETFRSLIVLGGNVAFAFKGVGTEIGGIAAQVAAFASGNLSGSIAIGEAMKKDAEDARKSFDEWEKRILEVGKVADKTGKEIVKALTPDETAAQAAAKVAKTAADARASAFIKSSNEIAAGIKKEENAYKSLAASIEKNLQIRGVEIELGRSMTSLEKDRNALQNVSMANAKKSAIADRERILAKLDLAIAEEKNAKYAKQAADEYLNLMKTMDSQGESIRKQIETQNDYNAKIGLTKEAIEQLEIAKLNDIAAGKDQNAQMLEAIGLETDLIESLREQAKAYRELADSKALGATKTAEENTKNIELEQAKKALNDLEQESKRFYDDLYRGLSDSLYRGFEAGKGFFQSFWDGIKNLFKTTVLKLAVQGVMTGVLGLGANGLANAQGLGAQGGLSSISTVYSMGKSLWDGFSAAGTVGGGVVTLGNALGSSTISAFGSGVSLSSTQAASAAAAYNGAGMTGTGAAIGAGQSVGAALPIVGWVLAGMAANNSLFDKGWGGQSTTETKNYGVMAGMIGGAFENTIQKMFGLSDKTASMLSGSAVVNRLFGHKNKELQQTEFTGNFGASGVSASMRDVYKQEGGVFRSDKWSEVKNSVGADQIKDLTNTFDAIKSAAAGYAGQLGLSTSALDTFSKSFQFNLSITGDAAKDAEANKKLMSDLIVGMTDDISSLLAPSIKTFSKEGETASATLARLAGNLTGVNAVVSSLGFDKFSQSLDGSNNAQKLLDLSGGFEKFTSGAAFFAENFLEEADKIKPAADLVAETLARMGQSSVDTIPEFRELVQGLDLASEAEAKLYTELIAIAPQFKAVADFAENSTEALQKRAAAEREFADAQKLANDTAQQRLGLQDEYNRLTMTSAELLTLQRDALFESNRGLFDSIQAVKAKQEAEAQVAQLAAEAIRKAQETAATITSERLSLQDQLNQLTLTETQLLSIQREKLDESNRALFDSIQAVKAKQQADSEAANAIREAAARASAIINERTGLQDQLNQLTMSNVDLLALQREKIDESNRALFDQIQAEKGRQSAIAASTAAAVQAAQAEKAARDQRDQELKASYTQWIGDIKSAFDRESGIFKNSVDQFMKLGDALNAYNDSLQTRSQSLLSPEAVYNASKAQFDTVASLARKGDQKALEQFQSVADAFLESSIKYNASGEAYFSDLENVKKSTKDSAISAYATADVARLQLNFLQKQVSGLIDINESVKTVAQLLGSGSTNYAAQTAGFSVNGSFDSGVTGVAQNILQFMGANGGFESLYTNASKGDEYSGNVLAQQLIRWSDWGLKQAEVDKLLGAGALKKVEALFNVTDQMYSGQLTTWNGENHTPIFSSKVTPQISDKETIDLLKEQNKLLTDLLNKTQQGNASNVTALNDVSKRLASIESNGALEAARS